MVDTAMIVRKLSDLDVYLNQIREFSDISLEAYLSDWKTRRVVERTLQIMIEACLDIAGHLISDRRLRTPTGYADAFKVLNENGVIDDAMLGVMEKMAKFRNIVVHQYEDVDAAIVLLILKNHLPAFSAFRDAVLQQMT